MIKQGILPNCTYVICVCKFSCTKQLGPGVHHTNAVLLVIFFFHLYINPYPIRTTYAFIDINEKKCEKMHITVTIAYTLNIYGGRGRGYIKSHIQYDFQKHCVHK